MTTMNQEKINVGPTVSQPPFLRFPCDVSRSGFQRAPFRPSMRRVPIAPARAGSCPLRASIRRPSPLPRREVRSGLDRLSYRLCLLGKACYIIWHGDSRRTNLAQEIAIFAARLRLLRYCLRRSACRSNLSASAFAYCNCAHSPRRSFGFHGAFGTPRTLHCWIVL